MTAPISPDQFGLSDMDKRYLDFEGGEHGGKRRGPKANEINKAFGHSEIRYYQQLNRLRTTPAAQEYAPDVTARLNRDLAAENKRRPVR